MDSNLNPLTNVLIDRRKLILHELTYTSPNDSEESDVIERSPDLTEKLKYFDKSASTLKLDKKPR